MIKVETKKSRIRPIIATLGASVFACAISVPAFALGTAPVSNQSGAANAATSYDRNAPLAGVQLAGGEGENEVQPQPYYGGEEAEHQNHEEAEHEHHEELEHQGREEMNNLGEEGEEHAERLRNRVEEERAEHQRHEMEEHNPDQGYNGDSD